MSSEKNKGRSALRNAKKSQDTTPGTSSLPDHTIAEFQSFKDVTEEPRKVAGLYFYSMLDCLVKLAYEVSCDFFRRPHLYRGLGNSDAKLAKVHARSGYDEEFPSKEQRNRIFVALFGNSGSSSMNDIGDFPRLRDHLVQAAAAFAERVYDTGVPMLRERVRTAHRPFKAYLLGLEGSSVGWSKAILLDLTQKYAYDILRNDEIAAVFGIARGPEAYWPYDYDSEADKLVEEISKQLGHKNESEPTYMPVSPETPAAPMSAPPAAPVTPALSTTPTVTAPVNNTPVLAGTSTSPNYTADGSPEIAKHITREHFTSLQRAALLGTEAIATIIDFEESMSDEDLDRLTEKVYVWGSALQSLRGVWRM